MKMMQSGERAERASHSQTRATQKQK